MSNEVPDEAKAFAELLRKFGVGVKGAITAETIAENIQQTGGEFVFEDPDKLAERLSTWHEYIPPVRRRQIIEHWFAQKSIPVSPEAFKKASATGAEIKKQEEEKRRKEEEEEEKKAKFAVDEKTGVIRQAREGEKPLTLSEAKALSAEIKGELSKEKTTEEPPFIQDAEGNWLLNPKARITGLDLLAYEALSKSQKAGEKRSPFEILKEEAETIQTLKAIFGGAETMGVKEFTDTIKALKELSSADEETKGLLSGIYKLLKEEREKPSNEIVALKEEINRLKSELERKERERLEERLKGIQDEVTRLRGELARTREEAKTRGEYDIMFEGLKIIDRRASEIQGLLQTILGRTPPPLGEETKKLLIEGISEEAKRTREIEELGEKIFFPK